MANIDWFTIIVFLTMVLLGWINIYSAQYDPERSSIFNLDMRYGKQFLWIVFSLMLAVIISLIDSRFYVFFAYLIYAIAILLLITVLIVGKEVKGAQSWISLGGFQIQPSEFAKPAVALALAKYLSGFNVNLKSFNTFLISAAIIFGPVLLIMLQPDTGSALVFFAFILPLYREGFSGAILIICITLIVLSLLVLLLEAWIILMILSLAGLIAWWFVSGSYISFLKAVSLFIFILAGVYDLHVATGEKLTYFYIGLITIVVSGLIYFIKLFVDRFRPGIILIGIVLTAVFYSFVVDYAFQNILSDYQQHRINIILGVETDPRGAGYNLNQSMIAIGSGGFTGKGFLNGTQTKLHFVPEQSTDFIFCTVGEEWGFLGSVVVIGLFLTLMFRLILLAERQRSAFARIYGYGILSVIFFHFFINISMTLGLFPVIGIPLPFFSYGGSSLWAFTIMLFIFLRLDASRMDYLK